MNDILFGQYVPGTSIVHRLDPRTKLAGALAFVVIVFSAQNAFALAVAGAACLAAFAFARIPLGRAFKSIAPLAFLVVLTALLNVLFVQGGEIYAQFWIIQITEKGLQTAAFVGVRLLILILGMSLLTLTTTTLDLTDAFERMMNPLRRIGVPAHELAMMMGIALRFVPQFAQEFIATRNAQTSRGAEFGSGFAGTVRALVSMMVPLFSSAFRHAETLSLAMDARCYHGGIGRTRLSPLSYSALDGGAAAFLAAILAVVVALDFAVPLLP